MHTTNRQTRRSDKPTNAAHGARGKKASKTIKDTCLANAAQCARVSLHPTVGCTIISGAKPQCATMALEIGTSGASNSYFTGAESKALALTQLCVGCAHRRRGRMCSSLVSIRYRGT